MHEENVGHKLLSFSVLLSPSVLFSTTTAQGTETLPLQVNAFSSVRLCSNSTAPGTVAGGGPSGLSPCSGESP